MSPCNVAAFASMTIVIYCIGVRCLGRYVRVCDCGASYWVARFCGQCGKTL